jgi:hypothetical protein
MRRTPNGLSAERDREIAVEDAPQRACGQWWNVARLQPEVAATMRAAAPRIVEALDELADLVMPKGVSDSLA